MRHALAEFGLEELPQLQALILRDPHAFTRLFKFLTIQVSEMFRDPRFFQALRRLVMPELRTHPSLKVWVAGCGTGEELWSLAILLHEEGLLSRTLFYATDISNEALRAAEAGVYAIDRLPGFSRNYLAAGGRGSLSDYYVAAYGSATFARALQARVVFADHSLATDSVFSEAHLVCCRNVLIYFDVALQERAIGLFKESLIRRGFLGLGSNETLRFSAHAAAFDASAPLERVYQKR